MACPSAAPLIFFCDCLCRFLGRRDDIVQTSSPFSIPASPPPSCDHSLSLFLTPSLLPPPYLQLSAFVSHAAAVQ